ncbi:cytospin-A-like isoform X1 [Haliotis rufescens]|uniref:cytospin-A-like isoform X1 n=2 Tax=Haliotis rufescens TaxID=6454 RepID=UPI001EAFC3FD|nr:cytospin-A-like isoform X1 [Haliotis rufescens]
MSARRSAKVGVVETTRRTPKVVHTSRMKKQEKNSTAAKAGSASSSAPSTTTAGQMGMKQSKSDSTSLSSKSQGKGSSNLAGKSYLSKSHENLSSTKKKMTLPPETSKPKPASGTSKPDSARSSTERNKENLALKEKEKNSNFAKPKAGKAPVAAGTIRKASSTQSIDKTSSGTSSQKPQPVSNKSQAMKRAQSTQNVSKDKLLNRKRTSAPADVMAYNAELLANFEKEKKNLEARISELTKLTESRKAEIEKFKYEVKALKELIPSQDVRDELEMLRNQNKHLQDRLKELGIPVEQITDTEKLLLKQTFGSNKSVGGSECNLPTSVSCDSLSTDGAKAAALPGHVGTLERSASMTASEPGFSLADLCGTPDHPSVLSLDPLNWDKQSNKSRDSDGLSEISVQCLTERILRMEETNYCTTEELQATLQELGDLQDAVNELTEENERLTDEKSVLLESLCTQTEKLETSRHQVEQLKSLLISGSLPEKSSREAHLVDLLKSAQEEREELLRKQNEIANAMHSMRSEYRENLDAIDAMRDKIQLGEDKISSLNAEREAQEQRMMEIKSQGKNDEIEIHRLKTLLENEKSKVQELEQFRKVVDKSDMEALLDNARQEKDRAEERLANIQKSLDHSRCEVMKLKEIMSTRDEEIKVAKNNAKTHINDLDYKLTKMEKERTDMQQQMEVLREHIDTLEQDCERYLEEQKTFTEKIQELQDELKKTHDTKSVAEAQLYEIRSRHEEESEEWKQFQKDLQVAVVIANDFRTETQEGMEKVVTENATLREKCKHLEAEVRRLRSDLDAFRAHKTLEEEPNTPFSKSIFTSAELKGKMLCTVDRELTALREGKKLDPRSQNLSVKSLIQSIEDQVKSGCSSIHSSLNGSRRNSNSTDDSFSAIQELLKSPTSPQAETPLQSPQGEFPIRSVFRKGSEKSSSHQRLSASGLNYIDKSPGDAPKTPPAFGRPEGEFTKVSPAISSILQNRGPPRRNSGANVDSERKENACKDPLAYLAKQMGGSKRNALLKWCQQKTVAYSHVDITNFSSSWNDGLAFCALLHSYLPERIPYQELNSDDKRQNFKLAFEAAESVDISTNLNINDMVAMERPDWQAIMSYVTNIYRHFELDGKS